MKVHVTGGHGFIGFHLVRELLKAGHDVRISDYPADVEDAQVVFHLAAQTSVPRSVADPVEDARANIDLTLRMLEACKGHFIFASSYLAIDPNTPYGLSKAAAESYVTHYGGSILRATTVYGRGGHSAIDVWMRQRIDAEPLTVFGGEQTRDFIHVDDVVNALLHLLGEGPGAEMLHVASGVQRPIGEVAKLISTNIQRSPRLQGDPDDGGTPPEDAWVWPVSVELEEGLKCY